MNKYRNFIDLVQRASKKPVRVIVKRVWEMIKVRLGIYYVPFKASLFDERSLIKGTGSRSLADLIGRLDQRSYFAQTNKTALDLKFKPEIDFQDIFLRAEKALKHSVDLLGTGPTELGPKIDWHKDCKCGVRWAPKYITRINYMNPNDSSDVKVPWEISRMQWMIPLGQAYVLNGNEEYANKVRDLLDHWIDENPYAQSVNWTCTMEVALRIFSFTWFFKVFHKSESWSEEFNSKLLQSIYLHGRFTISHLEESDINGNHFTADAAGLVTCGLFFGEGKEPQSWLDKGWEILNEELPRQVSEDGVDFEGSVPYHRLVLELFYFPMHYRMIHGLEVSREYKERIRKMALFAAVYSRENGTVPMWGDADDARTLPFRHNAINDHRYLAALVGLTLNHRELLSHFSGSTTEVDWVFGTQALKDKELEQAVPTSKSFPEGGYHVMRDSQKNHVFIDVAPVGLAGRGGHGHNDILSFEAQLSGVPIIVDSGAYVYTADFKARNQFRSTAYHNTPQIGNIEINPFIAWDDLWNLIYKAEPELQAWESNEEFSLLVGSHKGYANLPEPVLPRRLFYLNHVHSVLITVDRFEGTNTAGVTIPYHLSPELSVNKEGDVFLLKQQEKTFVLSQLDAQAWSLSEQDSEFSASYGVRVRSNQLVYSKSKLEKNDRLTIMLAEQENGLSESDLKALFNKHISAYPDFQLI